MIKNGNIMINNKIKGIVVNVSLFFAIFCMGNCYTVYLIYVITAPIEVASSPPYKKQCNIHIFTVSIISYPP